MHQGHRHGYEFRLPVDWTLAPGQSFGFDVSLIDADADGSASRMLWGGVPMGSRGRGGNSEGVESVHVSLRTNEGSERFELTDDAGRDLEIAFTAGYDAYLTI